jgi:hypothetical protein
MTDQAKATAEKECLCCSGKMKQVDICNCDCCEHETTLMGNVHACKKDEPKETVSELVRELMTLERNVRPEKGEEEHWNVAQLDVATKILDHFPAIASAFIAQEEKLKKMKEELKYMEIMSEDDGADDTKDCLKLINRAAQKNLSYLANE